MTFLFYDILTAGNFIILLSWNHDNWIYEKYSSHSLSKIEIDLPDVPLLILQTSCSHKGGLGEVTYGIVAASLSLDMLITSLSPTGSESGELLISMGVSSVSCPNLWSS